MRFDVFKILSSKFASLYAPVFAWFCLLQSFYPPTLPAGGTAGLPVQSRTFSSSSFRT